MGGKGVARLRLLGSSVSALQTCASVRVRAARVCWLVCGTPACMSGPRAPGNARQQEMQNWCCGPGAWKHKRPGAWKHGQGRHHCRRVPLTRRDPVALVQVSPENCSRAHHRTRHAWQRRQPRSGPAAISDHPIFVTSQQHLLSHPCRPHAAARRSGAQPHAAARGRGRTSWHRPTSATLGAGQQQNQSPDLDRPRLPLGEAHRRPRQPSLRQTGHRHQHGRISAVVPVSVSAAQT